MGQTKKQTRSSTKRGEPVITGKPVRDPARVPERSRTGIRGLPKDDFDAFWWKLCGSEERVCSMRQLLRETKTKAVLDDLETLIEAGLSEECVLEALDDGEKIRLLTTAISEVAIKTELSCRETATEPSVLQPPGYLATSWRPSLPPSSSCFQVVQQPNRQPR
jgi:hypothetical protein